MELCLPHVQACAMRVTRLGLDGVPAPGASSMIVSDALSTMGFAWEVEEGDEIREKNACGAIKVDYKAADNILRGNVTITLVTPDPFLMEMLSKGVVLSASGGRKGYGAPEVGAIDETRPVSIELWAKRILDGKLDTDWPYAWWVYPYVTKLRPGDHEHGNSNLGISFVGEAHQNDHWHNGPTNDWPSTSDRVWQWLPTSSVPTPVCGYQTVAAT